MNVETRTNTLTQEKLSFKSGQTWFDLQFGLLLQLDDTEKADSQDRRDEILKKVEAQVRRVGTALGERVRTSGKTLGDILHHSQENPELFPWVPYLDRQIVVNDELSKGFLPKQFDIAHSLVGQSATDLDVVICEAHTEPWESIKEPSSVYQFDNLEDVTKAAEAMAAPRDASNDVQLLIVRITSVVFQQGSLYPWIQGHIQELTLAATLLSGITTVVAAPGGVIIQNTINKFELHHQITLAVKGEPMAKYRDFQISYDELEREAGNAFNYEQRGLSDDERRRRIAYVQVALKIYLRINLKVDGVIGPETIGALKEFARLHNHPATVTNPFTRVDLLNVLSPRT